MSELREIKIVSRYDATRVLFAGQYDSVMACVEAAVRAGAPLARADLGGANLGGAYLEGADLADANLAGAYLARANLGGADLARADLADADLADANLAGAYLARAHLAGADLADANLAGAYLEGAHLARANLARANLADANLGGAALAGAKMPDGRSWEAYKIDPLAGICDEPEARKRALSAWDRHQWSDCPMHAAHGYNGIGDAPADKRRDVAAFVAAFDALLLTPPAVTP